MFVAYFTCIPGRSERERLGSKFSASNFAASKAGKKANFSIEIAVLTVIPSIAKQETINAGWMSCLLAIGIYEWSGNEASDKSQWNKSDTLPELPDFNTNRASIVAISSVDLVFQETVDTNAPQSTNDDACQGCNTRDKQGRD